MLKFRCSFLSTSTSPPKLRGSPKSFLCIIQFDWYEGTYFLLGRGRGYLQVDCPNPLRLSNNSRFCRDLPPKYIIKPSHPNWRTGAANMTKVHFSSVEKQDVIPADGSWLHHKMSRIFHLWVWISEKILGKEKVGYPHLKMRTWMFLVSDVVATSYQAYLVDIPYSWAFWRNFTGVRSW